jgi:hypothetical protein
MPRRGEAFHQFGQHKNEMSVKEHHEYKLGPWLRAGRRRYELRLWRYDGRQRRMVTKLFALVLDDEGLWHMWTVDETEWASLATPGLLTAKVRFYQSLYAAGWRGSEKEATNANGNTFQDYRRNPADEQIPDRSGGECERLASGEPRTHREGPEALSPSDTPNPAREVSRPVSGPRKRILTAPIPKGKTACGSDAQDARGKATVRPKAEGRHSRGRVCFRR